MQQIPIKDTSVPQKNVTEAALATYGAIIAIILSIAAVLVGFNRANMFAAIAFLPMILYFLHELMHRLFPKNPQEIELIYSRFSIQKFLLQDSLMFRLSLSLFFVALIATIAKYIIANQNSVEVISQITSQGI
jgi:hypothetical protein